MPPEGLYELEIKTGRAGLKFEKRLGCQYRGPGVENYADRYQKDTGKTKRNKLKLILEGEFHLTDGTGQEVVAKAGDSCTFQRALRSSSTRQRPRSDITVASARAARRDLAAKVGIRGAVVGLPL